MPGQIKNLDWRIVAVLLLGGVGGGGLTSLMPANAGAALAATVEEHTRIIATLAREQAQFNHMLHDEFEVFRDQLAANTRRDNERYDQTLARIDRLLLAMERRR